MDIDTDRDALLFIDPLRVKNSKILPLANVADEKIDSFFKWVFSLYAKGKKEEALDLLVFSKETNELHLGYSRTHGMGRGVSKEALDEVFDSILRNPSIASEILTNPSSLVILVPGFGEDRLSDLTASIIKKELYSFTMDQASLLGFEVDDVELHDYGHYWDHTEFLWKPLIGKSIRDEYGNPILFTPKDLVTNKLNYSAERFMSGVIFPVLKKQHIRLGSSLVRYESRANGEIVEIAPNNDMLYEYEVKPHYSINKVKRFNLKKTLETPEYYLYYIKRVSKKRNSKTLDDEILDEIIDKGN